MKFLFLDKEAKYPWLNEPEDEWRWEWESLDPDFEFSELVEPEDDFEISVSEILDLDNSNYNTWFFNLGFEILNFSNHFDILKYNNRFVTSLGSAKVIKVKDTSLKTERLYNIRLYPQSWRTLSAPAWFRVKARHNQMDTWDFDEEEEYHFEFLSEDKFDLVEENHALLHIKVINMRLLQLYYIRKITAPKKVTKAIDFFAQQLGITTEELQKIYQEEREAYKLSRQTFRKMEKFYVGTARRRGGG